MQVAHREWIEWTPNLTTVRASVAGGAARVRLESQTPNFDRYEMRPPGGSWLKTAPAFELKLEGTRIEREFRAVNTAGVAGPAAHLLIERQP